MSTTKYVTKFDSIRNFKNVSTHVSTTKYVVTKFDSIRNFNVSQMWIMETIDVYYIKRNAHEW